MQITEPDTRAEQLLEFVRTKLTRKANANIQIDTPLVSSGLIDSFALVEVVLKIESVTGRKIPRGRVRPADLDTVSKMLALAEKIGVPR